MKLYDNQILRFITSFFYLLIFFHPAQALCVPRNCSHVIESKGSSAPKEVPPQTHSTETNPSLSSSQQTQSFFPSSSKSVPDQASHKIVETPTSLNNVPDTNKPSLISSVAGRVTDMLKQGPQNGDLFPTMTQLNSAPTPTTTNPDLKKICDTTDYPDICLNTISPLVPGKTDALSVLHVAIKAAVEHVKLAQTAATKLSTLTTTADTRSSSSASGIKECKDTYNDALDNFQSAMDAIQRHDIGTINTMLSAAVTDFSQCEDAFQGLNSPLLDIDDKLHKMTSNCLAIASLMK
ncbi:pectinesterase inhibitor-like [Quillaja saponaria]|uniref:Pectinesterase inhibitor-like n=1 Tax=Quillaja saponaria TaxID=32244 RepID=A0AAD7QGG2_QUISA|nr:pectinesterase inhibitor-like [Quillaja saponaria]